MGNAHATNHSGTGRPARSGGDASGQQQQQQQQADDEAPPPAAPAAAPPPSATPPRTNASSSSPPSPTRSSPPLRPRGGGGDGGSSDAPWLLSAGAHHRNPAVAAGINAAPPPVTPPSARRGWSVGHRWGGAAGGGGSGSSLGGSSGIGALGGAINTANSPAAVTQEVLSSEPGVGTELPPVPPPPVVRPAMQQMSVMPLDAAAAVVDVEDDARTASFRAADAAARALAVEGGGVGAAAGVAAVTVDDLLATPPTIASAGGGGYLNQFGQVAHHPSSSLFRGGSNTSLASSVGAGPGLGAGGAAGIGVSVGVSVSAASAASLLGPLIDHNEEEEGDDASEGNDDGSNLVMTPPPPIAQYFPAGLHLSGNDGLMATEREHQQQQQQHDAGARAIANAHVAAYIIAASGVEGMLEPPDLTHESHDDGNAGNGPQERRRSDSVRSTSDASRTHQQPQVVRRASLHDVPQSQPPPLQPSSSSTAQTAHRAGAVTRRRSSSAHSVNSISTTGSNNDRPPISSMAAAHQIIDSNPGTTSIGRLRTRRPSTQTRRSSDSGHVLFSWGEDDSTSDMSSMQGSNASGLNYQPHPQFDSSANQLDYDQYRHHDAGMHNVEEEEGEEEEEPDVVRGGGRMDSQGAYAVYGAASASSAFTGSYAIGRSQSVQDELQHHQQGRQPQLAPLPPPPGTAAISNVAASAYTTPQDPIHGQAMPNYRQGDTPVGLGAGGVTTNVHDGFVADFLPEPAEQSEYMSRSVTTLVLSGRIGPAPVLANRTAAGGGGSGSTPASRKKRRQRANSYERQVGRGGGPNPVFTLMSREFTGRIPSGGGVVDRGVGGLAPTSSYLASMEGGHFHPRPSGVQDERLDEIHLRDEYYANGVGRSETRGSADGTEPLRNEPSRPLERGRRSSRVDAQRHRHIDRPLHPTASAAAPGRPVVYSRNARLRRLGGKALYQRVDRPAGGIASEAELLGRALDEADWAEVSVIVSRLAPRLIGDPMDQGGRGGGRNGNGGGGEGGGDASGAGVRPPSTDPHNPTYPRHYAGGGRLGLERLTFRQSSGVPLLLNVLRNPAFVGYHAVSTNDARSIPPDLVSAKLAPTWNEVMACLREMAYSMPDLVALGGELNEGGRLVPYLLTMLSHDSLFDGAASLIEEVLSLQSQVGGPGGGASAAGNSGAGGGNSASSGGASAAAAVSSVCALNGIFSPHPPPPPLTFSLTQVTDLYDLWSSFNPRKLAHFCRILALLVFEPEDRQLMESPSVLKSVELLQLRRDRAARSGAGVAPGGVDGCAVDRNLSIMLGDEKLIERLLSLLNIMNYAPDMGRGASAYHVMAHFPWIADTLLMLGLSELDDWREVRRLDRLSRSADDMKPFELGSVASMLESLAGPLLNPPSPNEVQNELGGEGLGMGFGGGNPNATHLGHIISVINAAQRAGVIVGQRRGRAGGGGSQQEEEGIEVERQGGNGGANNAAAVSVRAFSVGDDLPGDAAAARVVVDVEVADDDPPQPGSQGAGDASAHSSSRRRRRRIIHQADAANEMQFNALLLAPYQVEVLFVLCTLLGGRRKVDAQILLGSLGLVPLMDDMFDRLGWASSRQRDRAEGSSNSSESIDRGGGTNAGDGYGEAASAIFGFTSPNQDQDEEEHAGIHGPGCECNPESALRVQYLRLLHNFCDRDCDNYHGRRLLLSPTERDTIFSNDCDPSSFGRPLRGRKGLLSKIIIAYKAELDDSPYKFWLASCAESYLRGSSPQEQWFAAQSSGLLDHLVEDVLDDRLHCAGSLQTAFDLLGELCKGNVDSLIMLLECLGTEQRFQRLMSVTAANLVDSNVFVRALLLSVERVTSVRQASLRAQQSRHASTKDSGRLRSRSASPISAQSEGSNIACESNTDFFLPWMSDAGPSSRSYLTHSWWDTPTMSLPIDVREGHDHSLSLDWPLHERETVTHDEAICDDARQSDWYPPMPSIAYDESLPIFGGDTSHYSARPSMSHFGWTFSPRELDDHNDGTANSSSLFDATFCPDSVERLSWFLAINEARLLRDLLRAVDLRNINHENICCLNTAIVVAIFAHRRKNLSNVIDELRRMNDESKDNRKDDDEMGSRHPVGRSLSSSLHSAFEGLALDDATDVNDAEGKLKSPSRLSRVKRQSSSIGDCSDVLRNFRELLWFWKEYYTHRGRDRLSLEFSSHLRFQEWSEVVERLCADDGSETALLARPVRLPKSPFQRAPRTVDLRERR